MQEIPLRAIPSQTFTVNLNNQPCQIEVYQKLSGLYINLYVNNALIIGGVICQNLNRIVRDAYLGFQGDLGFFDNTKQGEDPIYTGLGSRFRLFYLEPQDLTDVPFYGLFSVQGSSYAVSSAS